MGVCVCVRACMRACVCYLQFLGNNHVKFHNSLILLLAFIFSSLCFELLLLSDGEMKVCVSLCH